MCFLVKNTKVLFTTTTTTTSATYEQLVVPSPHLMPRVLYINPDSCYFCSQCPARLAASTLLSLFRESVCAVAPASNGGFTADVSTSYSDTIPGLK
mmetsp:Transcript_15450/g.25143  ORF Transcript_15450/g.25143 Transcript_15450/m.25143 type:complete len:96 (+) Transcript_15450:103-390(+)